MKKTATLFSCRQSGLFSFFKNNVKILLMLFFLFSGLFLSSIKSVAQSSDFKQGANRDNTYNKVVGEINWIGSILQSANSRYVEGMSTLQRIILTDVPNCNTGGKHTLRVKLESDKSGNHAYDFITSWDNAFKAAAAIAPGFGLMPANRADPKLHECGPSIPNSMDDLCDLVTAGATGDFRDLPVIFDGTNAVGAGETNLAIPGDQNTTRKVIQNYEDRYPDNILANGESYGRSVRIYVSDGTLLGANGDANNRVVFVGYSAGEVYYDISWSSTSTTVVIEFAAHIAVGVDGLDADPEDADGLGVGYFLGQGASDINGGPYHVSMENFFPVNITVPAGQAAPNGSVCEGNLGSEDNQLQGSQVLLVPQCDLTGDQTVCEGETGLTYDGGVINTLNATYAWSILPNTSPTGAQITAGQGTAGPVTVTAGSPGTFTLNLLVTNGGTTQDADDNITSSCTVQVTVSGGPTIDCPDNVTVDACQTQLQINNAYVAWLATVTPTDASNNGGSVGPDKCGGVKPVIFTATNDCGTATCSASFTVTADNTPPGFTGNYDDVTLTCNSNIAPGSLGSASATDACGTPSITHTDGSIVTDGCLRSLKRTFTATDGCNNTATISRTVRWKAVLSDPILRIGGQSIPSLQEFDLGCQPPDVDVNATLGSATADNGCATPTVSAVTDPLSIDGCARSVRRTFTATDDCGHIVTAARVVRWIVNNVGPQVNATGAPITLGCNPSESDINGALGSVSATDVCANVTITSSDGPTTSDGCSRSRIRTFTATGGCGNTATASRTVTWKSDVTPPAFTGTYGDVSLGCNPENPDGSLGSASATDGCGAVTITSSDGDVQSNGCARWRIRTFTATDACLKTATTSRTVRWTFDNTPPAFTGTYSDVNLGCNPENPGGSLGSASATDGCGAVTITSSDGDVQSDGCARWRIRTFTATDACLKTATTSRTVRWTFDNTPPAFTGSYTDVNLNCNPANPDGSLGSASATDGCGAVTITSSDGAVQSDGCARWRIRTFTATDACLKTATTSRTVRWTSDNTGPVITCAASYTAACGTTNPEFTAPSASDACGTPTTVRLGDDVVQGECPTTYTRKWISTDACGNTSTCSQTVTVPCCSANCTYTQGKYGQDKDVSDACDGTTSANNPYSPSQLIEHNLLAYNGLLRVGCVGHSVTISTGEASCVLRVLPGGGSSGPLTVAGDFSICSLPLDYLSKKGTINNALLAQTITLGLNLGINPAGGLGNFAIQANKYLVTADLVACGSTTVKECTFNCTPNPNVIGQYIWTVATSPYHVSDCKFSQALYNALTTKNVAGLYALANSALCGDALPAGVTYSDITNAVDCINNAFDECRAFTGWFTEKPTANSFCTLPSATTPCPDPVTRITSQGAMESVAEVTSLKVSAYPNPFKDKVSFVINSQVSGQGSLQVYNMLGQRVATVYNGTIVAGRSQIVEYNAPRSFNGGMIYIFRVGGKQVTGKLINVE